MVWPPQNSPLFVYKKPCCSCDIECFLELPGDPLLGSTDIYDSLQDAQEAFTEDVSLCIVYTPFEDYNSYTVTYTAGTGALEINYDKTIVCGPAPPPPFPAFPCSGVGEQWFKINATAGALSIPYAVSSGGVPSGGVDEITVTFYDTDYNVVTTETDTTGGSTSGTFTPTLAAGIYLVKVYCLRRTVNTFPISPTMTVDISFTFAEGTVVCPARGRFPTSGAEIPYYNCCEGFEARWIGGIASICGFSEVPEYESTPPKKYYTKTFASDPGSPCEFDHDTCEPPSGGSCPDPISECTNCAGWCAIHCAPGCSAVCDATSITQTGCDDPGVDGVYVSLSDESTPADAITRLLAASSFSAWGSFPPRAIWGDSWVYGCGNDPFTFEYQDAEWRVNLTGLTPSTEYTITIKVWRRAIGDTDLTLYQTLEVSEFTDGGGNFAATDAVPNDPGYETIALWDCEIVLTPP